MLHPFALAPVARVETGRTTQSYNNPVRLSGTMKEYCYYLFSLPFIGLALRMVGLGVAFGYLVAMYPNSIDIGLEVVPI